MKKVFIFILLLAFINTTCTKVTEEGKIMTTNDYKGNAPEFPPGMDWLNTDKPIKVSELNGKIVILDFWTYCCINCIHVIPDLKRLEAKYPDELVVIGVHSAKFNTEKETDNIRQAILRYDIEHPVLNDKDFRVWTIYGVKAWPTLVLLNPVGDVAGYMSGEGIYKPFDEAIGKLLEEFKDVIDRTPNEFKLEKENHSGSILNYPGKVLADEVSGRLFITDSNNNRIIITDLDGSIIDIIGSGKSGNKDGSFSEAGFFKPQGTTLKDDILFIADTENHLIRKADLINRTVKTIAGTGLQEYVKIPGIDPLKTGLNSPWDIVISGTQLFIAMAGPHQLWSMDLDSNKLSIHAGSGYENIIDGELLSAALAQPSGITTDGNKLYFADSEVSAIRAADINRNGKVTTIIGHGLFDFGDIDGDENTARFQHPLGIVHVGGLLYVADTYNNKIKVVDPRTRKSRTLAGSGKEGNTDGSFESSTFDEPCGISYANEKLYVADTNNGAIRILNLKTKTVSTLELKNFDKIK
ncbi:MAG TPA: thioredoxin-like domain-containing protein [Ignavibacteriaceae bacterium]|nr:thioredoxin-like domain-containing protein [Ignavibacteriaceae bacterium]